MKMAKASQADLDMAMDVCSALDGISAHWPSMPEAISTGSDDERFYADSPEHCARVIDYLIKTMQRGSLSRVVWGCVTMLDSRNGLVDPNADTIERAPVVARPLAEWHEDMGAVLWWLLPVDDPPYCGQPGDSDWPGYHTHWTPIVVPSNVAQGDFKAAIKPRQQATPCGECHLQPGERRDVCGARAAQEGRG